MPWAWENLARQSVPRLALAGQKWGIARRWWGSAKPGEPMEFDVMAESGDGKTLLVGEAKLSATTAEVDRLKRQLQEKAARLPFAKRYRKVEAVVFLASAGHPTEVSNVVMLSDVMRVLI